MGGGRILADDAPGPLLAGRRAARGRGADGDAAAPGRAHQRADREGRPWMTASPARSRLLPGYAAQHVLLSMTALALGVAISLPLAILASRRPRLRWAALAVASLVQTIPGLALLALFYPLLLALSALTTRAVRLRRAGARLPAVAAGADDLFDAADPAQRRHRPHRRRPRLCGGGRRRRHDAPPAPVPRRTALGRAGDHGRHPHRGGMDHRHRDAEHRRRPDQPRQFHLLRSADRELDLRADRLHRRGDPGAVRRPGARPDRNRRGPPRRPAHRHRLCRAAARHRRGRGVAAARAGRRLRARREELLRAIYPRGIDGRAHRSRAATPSRARKGSAPPSSFARSPATRSTPMSIIPGRCGPT